MRCFSCFYPSTKSNPNSPTKAALLQDPSPGNLTFPIKDDDVPNPKATEPEPPKISDASKDNHSSNSNNTTNNKIEAQTFSFRELATATKNFRRECLIGEGGFGRVYKGKLEKTGQVVAVKQLDRNGLQGNREFLIEVLMLSLLHHPNLVNLIGYCADGDQRLLVYEYMPLGSLDNHLLDIRPHRKPLDCFGVVLLELITGRRVIDTTRPNKEQNLIAWAEPMFRDRSCFLRLADPLLKGDYPQKGFRQAIAVAAMCLQEEATVRPLMSDVVSALSFLGNCALVARTDASSSGP
ncbi:hypothetical protein V6N13_079861 [Hibiscus sabdariffa]